MKIKIALSIVLVFIMLVGKAQSIITKPSLTIGSPAPNIEVQQWLKGKPVEQFKKGQLYVVEFWATWCAPCIAAMPHLSELARKYQDKVTIIGVSVWEGRKKPVPDVSTLQTFVDKKGKDMDYNVAMDNSVTDKMAKSWLTAAGVGGIPATFVIDRNGKIAWIGHPNELGPVLEAQVNTPEKFNLVEAKEQHDQDFRRNFMYQSAKLVNDLLAEKNYGQAWQEVQKFVEEYPSFEIENFWSYVNVYLNYNSNAALAYVLEKSKDANFLKAKGGQINEDTAGDELLDEFARAAAGKTGLDANIYFMAIERLNKAIQKKPNVYNLWSLLALSYANLGEFDKAISAQEKGIEVFKKNNKSSGDQLHVMLTEKEMSRMTERIAAYNDLKNKKDMLMR